MPPARGRCDGARSYDPARLGKKGKHVATLFTSDLHFGHRLVSAHRGFDSTDAHDDAIARGWRSRVTDDDIVWVLGDIAVSNPNAALAILASLPGRKRLIAGNHDKVFPADRDAPRFFARYSAVFEYIAPFARIRLSGTEVLLSHFPYERDRGEVRYTQYRLPDEGMPLIHGHLHVKDRVVGREVHVGVDAWELRPATDAEVLALLYTDRTV